MIFLDIRDGSLGVAKSGVKTGNIQIRFFNMNNHPPLYVPTTSIIPFWLQKGDTLKLNNSRIIKVVDIDYDHKQEIHFVEYEFLPKTSEPTYRIDVELLGISIDGFV